MTQSREDKYLIMITDLPTTYPHFIEHLKSQIAAARVKVGLAINRELILLYWNIGREILKRQKEEGWGAKIIERISQDLSSSFPEMKGLSPRNLKYMRAFAEAYEDYQFVQEALAQVTWYHNLALLEKLKNNTQRLWYIEKTVEYGWSRNVLVHQIETNLYERQGKAITNFKDTLPKPHSDLAQELLKNPYNLEFLSLQKDAQERELEKSLLHKLRDFLLELGSGFAFVGSQYHFELEGEDFYIDLLMYHLKLRCYVVIELKTGKFMPEHAGQLNFYLNVVDDKLRHEHDNPTIGLILCKEQKGITAEYALKGLKNPVGVSSYVFTHALPQELEDDLPSIERLSEELSTEALENSEQEAE